MKLLWIGKGRRPFEVGDIVSNDSTTIAFTVERIEGVVLHGRSIYADEKMKSLAMDDAFVAVKRREDNGD